MIEFGKLQSKMLIFTEISYQIFDLIYYIYIIYYLFHTETQKKKYSKQNLVIFKRWIYNDINLHKYRQLDNNQRQNLVKSTTGNEYQCENDSIKEQ